MYARQDHSVDQEPQFCAAIADAMAFFIARYVPVQAAVTPHSVNQEDDMTLQFGVFDHIEPVPGLDLEHIYAHRLMQIERLDTAGFYAYHLAEHHTPAVHSLAPSQNVFLAAVSQRTTRLRFGPCVYVLPLHHPVRLIEEISMLDNLSGGRMEIGVGRGGVLEAYFWGQDADVEVNYARYLETLAIIREGLSHDELTYHGQFYDFDNLPMRMRPKQTPYPPLWYMRNIETAARHGMNAMLDVSLGEFDAYVKRYRELWEEHQGVGALTLQGDRAENWPDHAHAPRRDGRRGRGRGETRLGRVPLEPGDAPPRRSRKARPHPVPRRPIWDAARLLPRPAKCDVTCSPLLYVLRNRSSVA